MEKNVVDLRLENDERRLVLDFAGREMLANVSDYLRSAPISPYHREQVRRDILDLLIEAQERGESPVQVLGEDYEAFCDKLVAKMPKAGRQERKWDLIQRVLAAVLAGIAYVFILRNVMYGDRGMISFTLGSAAALLAMAAASFHMEIHRGKYAAKVGIQRYFVGVGLLVLGTGIAVLLEKLFPVILFQVHISVVLAIVAVLFICYAILYHKTGVL